MEEEEAVPTTERATTLPTGIEADLLWNGADMTITTVATTTIAESPETTATAPNGPNGIMATGNITTVTTEVRPHGAAEDTAAAAVAGIEIGTTGGTTISGGGTGDPLADAAAEDTTTTVDAVASVGEEGIGEWTETSTRGTSFPTT